MYLTFVNIIVREEREEEGRGEGGEEIKDTLPCIHVGLKKDMREY